MEKEAYRKNAYDMLYLISCLLNEQKPSADRISDIDLNGLYSVAKNHTLLGITAYSLENAGISDKKFNIAKAQAIRKNILMDEERKAILSELEKNCVWYLTLKGAVIKEFYPKIGMREMSDNDILYDSTGTDTVKKIMYGRGFKLDCSEDTWHEFIFIKPPVYNFELHDSLFYSLTALPQFTEYYADVEKRLISKDSRHEKFFSDEDFYVYIVSHEYKHFKLGGTGLRSLADIYVCMKHFGDRLDRDYINKELEVLDIGEHEREQRELAALIFDPVFWERPEKNIDTSQSELFDYYIFSGTYGNLENLVKNRVSLSEDSNKKKGYIKRRLFLDEEAIKCNYPFFYKHKWLRPALFVYRLGRAATVSRKRVKSEIKIVNNLDNGEQ